MENRTGGTLFNGTTPAPPDLQCYDGGVTPSMRTVTRVAVVAAIVIALAYVVDAAWVRIRLATHRDPTSRVDVAVTVTVPQKNGRVGLFPGGVETRSCVRSLFPQLGLAPCWYIERHTEERINY